MASIVSFALLLAAPAPAAAVVVSFTFQGSFSSSDFPGISAGDPFSGSFSYDTDASLDSAPAGDLGIYPLVSASLTTPLGTATGISLIALQLDLTSGSGSEHNLAVIFDGQFGSQGFNADLRLNDSSGTVFPNDDPPASLALGSFDSALIDIDFFVSEPQEPHASGPLRSLTQVDGRPVSSPGALVLVAAGVAAALGLGRRRR